MTDLQAVLTIGAGLVVAVLLVVLAPAIGALWWPLWLLWEYTRPRSNRIARRKAAQARHLRTQQLVQLHLTAHKLPDTPINREQVLQALCKPVRAGRGR